MAGANFARTLAFLITCPIGWFIWVGPRVREYFGRVREYFERVNRRQS
jgi:hypothetical protein